ncbi:MAG: hypothetical protein AMQ74_00046 [Candidatus Methanofastidiosum methylothiophilum]|uniref:Uncharacterized protein n=1 Tax=Candidatus Methanofastidiosum methylothiophilum TaxID=1705564 RepID=A0A150JB37_9EURY|nr:MAG: hypothetical protein AMQ74_00046 [Candidatus Methanofastidiosum methylthiophilus]NMC76439.1 hypothetical protein [Candidatus Methanofastidiosa archaeon]
MDDNHKIGLVFALTGLIAGIISGFGYLPKVAGMDTSIVVAIVIFYVSQYLVKMVGVDMTKFSRSSILKSGFFSFLGSWLLFWIIIFNA